MVPVEFCDGKGVHLVRVVGEPPHAVARSDLVAEIAPGAREPVRELDGRPVADDVRAMRKVENNGGHLTSLCRNMFRLQGLPVTRRTVSTSSSTDTDRPDPMITLPA